MGLVVTSSHGSAEKIQTSALIFFNGDGNLPSGTDIFGPCFSPVYFCVRRVERTWMWLHLLSFNVLLI